jgi:hypothetical protein
MVAGSRLNNVLVNIGFPAWTEFYRDHDAAWPATLPAAMAEDTDGSPNFLPLSVEQRSSPFDFPPASLRADYYATWRLTSPTSPPFLMLSAAKTTSHQFVFDYDYNGAAYGPDIQAADVPNATARTVYFSATDDAGSFAAYEASRNELQAWATAANGGLMVVYNQDFPDQYMVQRVNSITWDNAATRIGFELQPVKTGTPFVDPGAFSFGYYAKANNAALGYPANAIWGGAGTYWPATLQGHVGGWAPAEDFYPFPSEYFSISRTGASFSTPEPFDLNSNAVDIRRIAYYYNNLPAVATRHRHRPKIIGIPIVATTFYLAAGVTPPGCDTHYGFADFRQSPGCPANLPSIFYSLRMRTLPGNQEVILIPRLKDSLPNPRVVATDDPTQGYVTFIRQLGSQIVTVVVK